MMKRFTPAVAAVLLVLAACAPRFQQPEIELAGVRLGGIGLQGGLLYVQLEVYNPNGFDLRADGLRYDLDLAAAGAQGEPDWVDIAEGEFRERIQVPEYTRTVVEIPVQFTYSAAGAAIRSMLERGTLDYRVQGRVDVTSPVRRDLPFRKAGRVSMTGESL